MAPTLLETLAQTNAYVSIRDASKHHVPKISLPGLASRTSDFIISCVDPRADPKDFWNITPDTPVQIARNAGGRAVDALRSLEVLAGISAGLESVAVVHHTNCGGGPQGPDTAHLRRVLRERKKGSDEEVGDLEGREWALYKHQTEEESVKEDMRLILADGLLPKDLKVLGFVLDVETNKTTEVFLD